MNIKEEQKQKQTKKRSFPFFIVETIIFRIKVWCNGIFYRNTLSRGYPTKLENYGNSRGWGV